MADSQASVIAQETAPAGAGAPPPAWLTRLTRRPFAVLTLLGLLLWLPGVLSLPALDRDESRFAQSSRQMVESGDVVDIRFGHVPRYKKPVGIYWLQAAATRIAMLAPKIHDDHIWTYRLPSLLGGIAASWLTLWCALAVAEAEAALLAGLLMLGTVLLTAEATIATTDAVLLACVLGVQGVLLRLYRAARDGDFVTPQSRTVMWGFAALGFGILVKGPVVLGVGAATLTALVAWDWWIARPKRKPAAPAEPVSKLVTEPAPVAQDAPESESAWAWLVVLKSWRGLLLVLLLTAPWLIAITVQSRGAFLEQSLGDDFAAKMAGGQESHGGWPGYYLLLSAAAFWPTILFVLPGIAYGVSRRAEPAVRFLLAWAASWWLVVELVPTKLPHYVIHAYPALAILAALFVLDSRAVKFLAPARWIAIAQFVLGAVLLTVAILLAPHYFGGDVKWPVMTAAGLGASLALGALVLAIRRKSLPAILLGFVSLLVFAPALTAYVGPRLDQLWISEKLKPMVESASRPGDAPPAVAGYQEPSLLFALGKDLVLADGKGAAEASARSGSLALVEDEALGDFLARLAELQADARPVGEVTGMNYSRGRRMHVTVYRVAQLRELN
jgi:4-amino-4-deoxy-L-arabinose transferase-like glycosyltransferase